MPDIRDISSFSFALQPGTKLHQYVIESKLGMGGFTITYLAQDEQSDRRVVIKEHFSNRWCRRDENNQKVAPMSKHTLQLHDISLRHFMHRASAFSKLAHKSIVLIYKYFIENNTGYYVMPYISGTPLNMVAANQNIVTGEWLLHQLKELLKALAYMHSNELFHLDIKPRNILITDYGEPVLIEMRLYDNVDKYGEDNYIVSTPFEAIEQNTPLRNIGPWTDLYSLGATFYKIITGEYPPIAIERIVEDCYTPLAENSSYTSRFPSELLSSIDKALHLLQKNRWQSAQEWLDALNTPPQKNSQPGKQVMSQTSHLRAFFDKIRSAFTKKKEKKS